MAATCKKNSCIRTGYYVLKIYFLAKCDVIVGLAIGKSKTNIGFYY